MASLKTNNNLSYRSAVYRAVSEATPESLEIVGNFWREERVRPIDKHGDTVLHLLAMHGNVDAFRILFQECLVTNEDLKTKNVKGDTALHEAARFGQKDAAEIILRREKDLVQERNNLGETPLFVAAVMGKKEVFTVLEDFDSDRMTRRNDGYTILHAAVMGERYSLAISISESYPNLARKRDEKGCTALHLLAAKPESFKSGSTFMFKDLGRRPFVPLQIIEAIIYTCIPALYTERQPVKSAEDPLNNAVTIRKVTRFPFTKFILGKPWLKNIDDAKQRHEVALMLAEKLIRREDWTDYIRTENKDVNGSEFGISSQKKNRIPDPLIRAARLGITEITEQILKVYPEAAETYDENRKNILHIAVEHKHRFLYDYLMNTIAHKHRMLCEFDNKGNSIMHLAASLGSPPGSPFGTVLQMTWDVLWYKRVKYESYTYLWHQRNQDGMTPMQIFEAKHLNLREKAEKSIKDMANCVLIVSALIGTINFAAVFTVPGGFKQDNGLPYFLNNTDFYWLMFSLAGGLFSSVYTMGTLLAITFSRFETEEFHVALPLKYVITTIAMAFSAGFTIMACYEAYAVEAQFKRISSHLLLLVFSYILMCLVYLDTTFLMFVHMYYVIIYSFSYRVQET